MRVSKGFVRILLWSDLVKAKPREQGLKFQVKKQMTAHWYQSRRVVEAYSGFKVLVEEETNPTLGTPAWRRSRRSH